MESLEQFKKYTESAIDRVYQGNVVLFPFLDESFGAYLEGICKNNHIDYYKFGKINNSDRNRYILSNYDVKESDFKIVLYKVKYNSKYNEITHRNMLGSLMGLGIKRDSIGDIVILDNKDVYFAVTEEISKYIENEFRFVGKCPIELIRTDSNVTNVIKYDTKELILSSLRIDCVIAGVYSISRSEALDNIIEGNVQLNHLTILNPSQILKDGDTISVRHKGKFTLGSLNGKTRTDRLKVVINKRI